MLERKKQIAGLQLTTIEDKMITIGAGSPLPTLLVLFTTWCGSCQKAAPIISSTFGRYTDRLQLVGIGREHTAEELQEWATEIDSQYQLVADADRALFQQFATMHVPRFYLIDTTGKVLYQDVNWHPFMLEDIQVAIDKLLKK